MNRRQFFGMSAAAVALAGLPAIVLPERKIFLPPRGGWYGEAIQMREVQQYLINYDAFALRYDAKWLKPDGAWVQYHIDTEVGLVPPVGPEREQLIEVARSLIRDRMRLDGFVKFLPLDLPRGVFGRYV